MPLNPVQTLQLEVVQTADADLREVKRPHPGGRPRFLDGRRFIRICWEIEKGESASEACRRELVSYRHFRYRAVQIPSFARRLKKAEEVRESYLKEEHMANIRAHAPRNLLASLWWLERRYPDQFALRSVFRPAEQQDQQPEPELPAAILAEHRRLQLSIIEEDRARRAGS